MVSWLLTKYYEEIAISCQKIAFCNLTCIPIKNATNPKNHDYENIIFLINILQVYYEMTSHG